MHTPDQTFMHAHVQTHANAHTHMHVYMHAHTCSQRNYVYTRRVNQSFVAALQFTQVHMQKRINAVLTEEPSVFVPRQCPLLPVVLVGGVAVYEMSGR